jgi:muramoyltetrapeptide carboxypeptidase LdcA involved in peptidoglycan recycling
MDDKPPPVFPPKLGPGDHVRVIAPSRSLAIIRDEARALANRRMAELGLTVSWGAHVGEHDQFDSSSVASRVADLHDAFADRDVSGVMTVVGGFNSNQLLERIDWDLIAANPKVFCGFSDITALQAAVLARTGLVTYSGPHWSSFGMRDHLDDTLDWFRACLFRSEAGGAGDEPIELGAARAWSDDLWYIDQDDRVVEPNPGWWVLSEGADARVEGRLVGTNLSTLALLHGTELMPALDGAILFLEDDFESQVHHFDRQLTSLLQQPDASGIRALVIGRFQRSSNVTRELLAAVVRTKPRLDGVPVVANLDFGHTTPLLTLPVGGTVRVEVERGRARITLLEH